MKMTNDEYKDYSERHIPSSPLLPDMLKAFAVGGLICCIGQLIGDLYLDAGLGKTAAATAASVTLVFIGALLTGLGVYDRIAVFAGGGSLVPITGFANSVVAPALEFKTEGLVTGTAAKMFVIAGPVIVYGVGASVVYGVLLCLFGG
ncbi:MAG: stage V sporulation protein AC [Clostridia bacterium]|nr:stage V sporulation protein AC [Clostridia bacterium]